MTDDSRLSLAEIRSKLDTRLAEREHRENQLKELKKANERAIRRAERAKTILERA